MTKTTLDDLALVLRSKNAGAFYTTIDVFFSEEANYRRAAADGVLTVEKVAAAYNLPTDDVLGIYRLDPALGIKVTLRKTLSAHNPANTDVMGAQQHLPLAAIEVD